MEVRVSNTGDAPTLVPNTVSTASGGFAYLELELTDAHGHSSGGTVMIADYAPVEQSDATQRLSYSVLGPYSIRKLHCYSMFP